MGREAGLWPTTGKGLNALPTATLGAVLYKSVQVRPVSPAQQKSCKRRRSIGLSSFAKPIRANSSSFRGPFSSRHPHATPKAQFHRESPLATIAIHPLRPCASPLPLGYDRLERTRRDGIRQPAVLSPHPPYPGSQKPPAVPSFPRFKISRGPSLAFKKLLDPHTSTLRNYLTPKNQKLTTG